jgi:Leucine-rich repeat (LRR) protein
VGLFFCDYFIFFNKKNCSVKIKSIYLLYKYLLMKKIYFLILAFCFFNGLSAQVINFPDANFKAKLISSTVYSNTVFNLEGKSIKVDTNGNGEIEIIEAEQVGELYLTEYDVPKRISSLTGILFFKNLKNITLEFGLITTANFEGLKKMESVVLGGNQKLTSINLNDLSNLKTLDINGCRVPNIDLSSLINLQNLNCNANGLTKLDLTSLSNLESLRCTYNLFTTLKIVDFKKLTILDCSNNPLIGLVLSGLDNLSELKCDYTNILNLNLNNLSKLENIICRWGKLEDLNVSSLPNLKKLECHNNRLSKLSVSDTDQLEWLSCGSNILSDLNLSNFKVLKFLNCDTNNLTSLDLGNLSKLEELYCGNNQLTSLNVQSALNIEKISCSNNAIKELDLTGLYKISMLACNNNKIEELNLNDAKNILEIHCNNNNLIYLFVKNGVREGFRVYAVFNFDGNPNLKYICADDFDFEYIESYLKNYGLSKVNLNTYCTFKPGGDFYTVQASSKIDLDRNGCDLNDDSICKIKYNVVGDLSSGVLVSNRSETSSIDLQAGNYKVVPVLEHPDFFDISPKEISVSFPNNVSPSNQNFCIIPIGNKTDLEIIFIPVNSAVTGFDADYIIQFNNNGNTIESGSISFKFDNNVLHYLSSSQATSSKTFGELKWEFTNLKPFESREISLKLYLNRPTDKPSVTIGDILKFSNIITSYKNDENPMDNTFLLNQTVVGSHDPNDKRCLEGSIITPSLIGEYVHYMIRFENLGTYYARNIVVTDMIDLNKFDIKTLIPTSSSHSYITKISQGNKVEFIFENINLPFDDANNDGYIAFKIKTKPTLKVGDSFDNEANIYFDYNFPVLTNKATSKFATTLGTQDFEFSNYFKVYPIPANEVLNISEIQNVQIQSIGVYDILGQMVIALPNVKDTSKIDVSNLSSGNYFIKIKSDKGSSSLKFIKN